MNSKKRKKISPESYRERTYRNNVMAEGLVSSYVSVRETDLHILAARNVEHEAKDKVYQLRNQLENFIAECPGFLASLLPLDNGPLAPPIINDMLRAATAADVGPMAAVAGAIAEYVGRDLLDTGLEEVMVENGGDIFLKRNGDCGISIFAGQSPLNEKVGIRVPAASMPVGICTSSGTVGHSLSLGQADSVTVLAASTPLADAAATRLGNEVSAGGKENINHALEVARTIPGLLGVVIICGEQMGAWGEIDLVGLD